MTQSTHNQGGIGILEVIIAVGMATVLITSIGGALGANHRLTAAAEAKTDALAKAQEAIEIVTVIQHEAFGCSGAAGTTCTADDDQTCEPRDGYSSCWTAMPRNASGSLPNEPLRVMPVGSTSWELEKIIGTPADFTPVISIKNLCRNVDGELTPSCDTPDTNTKEVTVTVSWEESSISLSTILTAWENKP